MQTNRLLNVKGHIYTSQTIMATAKGSENIGANSSAYTRNSGSEHAKSDHDHKCKDEKCKEAPKALDIFQAVKAG